MIFDLISFSLYPFYFYVSLLPSPIQTCYHYPNQIQSRNRCRLLFSSSIHGGESHISLGRNPFQHQLI
ncbi:unnamed protein product [Arabidopsis halleri]